MCVGFFFEGLTGSGYKYGDERRGREWFFMRAEGTMYRDEDDGF